MNSHTSFFSLFTKPRGGAILLPFLQSQDFLFKSNISFFEVVSLSFLRSLSLFRSSFVQFVLRRSISTVKTLSLLVTRCLGGGGGVARLGGGGGGRRRRRGLPAAGGHRTNLKFDIH